MVISVDDSPPSVDVRDGGGIFNIGSNAGNYGGSNISDNGGISWIVLRKYYIQESPGNSYFSSKKYIDKMIHGYLEKIINATYLHH